MDDACLPDGKGFNPPLATVSMSSIRNAKLFMKSLETKVLKSSKPPRADFTTKPIVHGTCLGLSLAYDIVKAHGGELIVETRKGEGSVFRISLNVE